MKKEKYMSWEAYFMSIAILSSFRSKDKKTQNGACIVNKKNKVIGVGYNGLPYGLDDENPQFWSDDDNDIQNSKHSYVVHAEANAIYNKNQKNSENSTLYVTMFPCRECAKALIQNGITKVIYLGKKDHHNKINETVEFMFKSAGIEYIKFSELEIDDKEVIQELLKIKKTYY